MPARVRDPVRYSGRPRPEMSTTSLQGDDVYGGARAVYSVDPLQSHGKGDARRTPVSDIVPGDLVRNKLNLSRGKSVGLVIDILPDGGWYGETMAVVVVGYAGGTWGPEQSFEIKVPIGHLEIIPEKL